jgi:hypothetical protein
MSILKNVGKLFIETEERDSEEELIKQTNEISSIVQEVNLPQANINTGVVVHIEDIYNENYLNDKTKSIFKVEEIKSVLPDTLPNETKKASVLGMMSVSGLTLESVLLDAENRIGILNSALQKFTETTVEIINDSQDQINKLEEMINDLKEKITVRKKEQETQEQIINQEKEKINNTVNFIK